MGRRTRRGICAVCGKDSELTFEHVPPRSCYNDRSVNLLEGTKALGLAPGDLRHGRIQQRGAGGFYTCARCNNATGQMYVPETIRWVERGADVLSRIGGFAGQDAQTFSRFVGVTFVAVKPLLFLKQVVYMFLCINGSGFTAAHPDLRAFVLNRDSRDISDVCHFHLALTCGPNARSVAGSAVANTNTGGTTYISDISFPPYSYAMWLGQPYDKLAPCEITYYKAYQPFDVCDVTLVLQVGFTHLAFPSDHRSRAALDRQARASQEWSG